MSLFKRIKQKLLELLIHKFFIPEVACKNSNVDYHKIKMPNGRIFYSSDVYDYLNELISYRDDLNQRINYKLKCYRGAYDVICNSKLDEYMLLNDLQDLNGKDKILHTIQWARGIMHTAHNGHIPKITNICGATVFDYKNPKFKMNRV